MYVHTHTDICSNPGAFYPASCIGGATFLTGLVQTLNVGRIKEEVSRFVYEGIERYVLKGRCFGALNRL